MLPNTSILMQNSTCIILLDFPRGLKFIIYALYKTFDEISVLYTHKYKIYTYKVK